MPQKPRRFDYNLIVIGAGSGGLVASYIAAAVKAKVALIEKHRMGGDCLNTGCVPSKALIRTARLVADIKRAAELGLKRTSVEFDFAEVMERVQRVIREIEPHDSIERYSKLGVDCITGEARLMDPWRVGVNGQTLTARAIILATGASPLVPPIHGLDEIDYLTSNTVWNLRALPKRLVILGGGPIGIELAQAFAHFGSDVTVVEMAPQILVREDGDVIDLISQRLRDEGVTLLTGHKAKTFVKENGKTLLIADAGGKDVSIPFDRVIVALGRQPNVEGFGLEELGIKLSEKRSIAADPFLRTNIPHIFVCGDVAGPYQFTHAAAHQAWHASLNALLSPFWKFKVDYNSLPWATFTDPEIARVGLNEKDAREKSIACEVTKYGIDDLDRAICESEAHGFVKVLTKPKTDEILGVTIVGAHAGDLIAEFVLAMRHGLGLNKILSAIHIYPTFAEANKFAAGAWKRAHSPQWALKLAERFHTWRR